MSVLAPVLGFVFPMLPLATWYLLDPGHAGPRPVPANLCLLVPPDLLARIVPTGTVSDVESRNSEPFINHAGCTVETDRETATTTASGDLSIGLDRHGSVGGSRPAAMAQNGFVVTKKFHVEHTIVRYRVFDVAGLGDSAFVAVREQSESDREDHTTTAVVVVLHKDAELTVSYTASPSEEGPVVSAAVEVARGLLRQLR